MSFANLRQVNSGHGEFPEASPSPMRPNLAPTSGGLSLKMLQRLDEATLDMLDGATPGTPGHAAGKKERELSFPGTRDLHAEYLKQRRIDAEERRLSRRNNSARGVSRAGSGVDPSASPQRRGRRNVRPSWNRHTSRASSGGFGTPSQSPPRMAYGRSPPSGPADKAARHAAPSPDPVPVLDARSLWHDHLEGNPSLDDGAARRGGRKQHAMSLKSPEQLHWHQYRNRPVHERLLDSSHKQKTFQKIKSDESKRFNEECPFEPALCIATVMGTFPGSKRKSAVRRAATPRATPGASVRFVTIHAPADGGSDRMSDDSLAPRGDDDIDDIGPPPRRRMSGSRGVGGARPQTPHFMEPLPVPPPPPAPRGPHITAKAKAMRRTRRDLHEWVHAREERLDNLADAVLTERGLRELGEVRDPELNLASVEIVNSLGDRHIDVYAHAEMDALARQADARRRIAAREQEQSLDMRRAPSPAATRKRAAAADSAAQPKRAAKAAPVDLAWFSQMVRSDTAYAANQS